MYFDKAAKEASDFLSLFATTPLTALVNGNIAVMYFMVLTGFLVGIYFSCCTMFDTPLYSWWYAIPVVHKSLLRGLGMAILIFAFTNTPAIQRILSWKPLLKLGEASFEIYALHWPLMLSMEAALFMAFRKTMPYQASAVLALVVTLPVIFAASFLVHYLIGRYNKLLASIRKKA